VTRRATCDADHAGVSRQWQGARTQLDAAVSVPILLYLDSGSENNYIAPSASIRGRVEVVQDLFFVTGTANISQRFASPFGELPSDLVTPTDNRYTSQSYSLGAYVTHTAPNNVEYLVAQPIYWNVPSDAPDFLRNTYTNNFEARPLTNIQATGMVVVLHADHGRVHRTARRT